MFCEDLSRLRKLQKVMKQSPVFDEKNRFIYRNIQRCQTPMGAHSHGALVVAGKNDGKILGMGHCGNAWICPVCAPRAASRQANLITAAIALLKKESLVPVMLTLTIPHSRIFKLPTLIKAMAKSWTFCKNDYRSAQSQSPFAKFWRQFKIHHIIKTCEITYSFKNGWHPHYHVLLFVPEKSIQMIKLFEEGMAEKWTKTCVNYLTRSLNGYPEAQRQLQILVSKTNQPGLYFSKDAHGNIRVADCATYIAGWNLPSEMTAGSVAKKASDFGNIKRFSIADIVNLSIQSEISMKSNELQPAAGSPQEEVRAWNADTWTGLLKELLEAVHKKTARWAWSHTGLKTRASQLIDTTGITEFKKKYMGVENPPKYHVVAFIPSELLRRLYYDGVWLEIEEAISKMFLTNTATYNAIAELFRRKNYPAPLPDFPGKLNLENIVQIAA